MDKQILVFATGNLHKLKEVNMMFKETSYIAKAMSEYNVLEDIPENGLTMHANAKLKSDYLLKKLGISSFGEDSGLEIDALDMRPGIYTARYAGEHRDDLDNMNKVLKELENIEDRNAQFRSVISLNLKGENHFFEGIVKGKIAYQMTGDKGFGYDPIFIPQGYDKTFAQLGDEIKNQFSHRAHSVAKMVEFLKSLDV